MPLSDSSALRWIEKVSCGDESAVERLWAVYFPKLVRLAQNRLGQRQRKVIDAEDLALSAFHSFCKGVANNRFPSLTGKDSLWRLLVSITLNKTFQAIRDQGRLKRGGGFRELPYIDDGKGYEQTITNLVSREPSPEFAIELADQLNSLLGALGDRELAQIAQWKLEAYSNQEIATFAGKSLRTIERKLNIIHRIWLQMPDSEL